MNVENLTEEILASIEHFNNERQDLFLQSVIWQHLSDLLRTSIYARRYQENYFRSVGQLKNVRNAEKAALIEKKRHYLVMAKKYEKKLDAILQSFIQQKQNFDIQFNSVTT